jgi:sugar O-acyltransferase (sialic acid O-acetyltransferase NeuD family)
MSINQEICIIGAGGHAKVVIATVQAAGYRVKAVLDDDSHKWGEDLQGIPIVGAPSELETLSSPHAVIAIGANNVRKAIAHRFPRVEWITAVHPTAFVHPSVRLGPGTVVFAGAIIQPGTVVGSHCIINTATSVDHDCFLADYVHIAPGTCLAGGVNLGEGVFLGIGSSAIPGVKVGSWTVVGAGGVVTCDLMPGVLALGVPASPVKKMDPL